LKSLQYVTAILRLFVILKKLETTSSELNRTRIFYTVSAHSCWQNSHFMKKVTKEIVRRIGSWNKLCSGKYKGVVGYEDANIFEFSGLLKKSFPSFAYNFKMKKIFFKMQMLQMFVGKQDADVISKRNELFVLVGLECCHNL